MPFPFGHPMIPRLLCATVRGGQRLAAAVVIIAVGLAGTTARASYVTATFSTVNPGEVVTITSGGKSETGWAGIYNFTNASGYTTGNIQGFCIDIAQAIYSGTTVTFNVDSLANAPVPGPAMGAKKADLVRELWGRDYALIGTDNVKAAAFQIDIWEIINETSSTLDIRHGNFFVSGVNSATLDQAQTWLNQLTGTGPKADNLIALTSATYQDYVVYATPAPPSLVLGGVGALSLLLPLCWRYRKRVSFTAARAAC
jgi:hypothetical protein